MLLTLIRAAILYVFVILMVKFMGKRQVGQLQPAEFVITILISDIVTMPVQDASLSLISSMIAVILLVSLEVLLSGLNLKSFKLRTAVQGNSLIVIRNGVVDQPQLKRLRIGMDDLLEALRLKDVFDINEVQYAIVETNGELSVMLKPEKRNVTAEMMKIKSEDEGIPCSVVIDGFIVESSFKDCGMTREKLESIIKKNKIPLEKIMLMTVDKGGNTTIIKRDEKNLKRMILAAALIAAVCIVSVSGYLLMNKKTADILDLIDEAAAIAESADFEKMKSSAEKISEEWKKSRVIISKTVRHGNMDELVEVLANMESAAENEDKEEFKKACRESRALLEHIRNTERVTAGNVF